MSPTTNIQVVSSFDENDYPNYPNLDVVVLAALEKFMLDGLPKVDDDIRTIKRPLVFGSGNALVAGKILYPNGVFADENDYEDVLRANPDLKQALTISASGGKHAPKATEFFKNNGLETILLTCNPNAPAKPHATRMIVTPKNREPYTYNTSTYMGMLLAFFPESVQDIYNFIKDRMDMWVPPAPYFKQFDAFYFVIDKSFLDVKEMYLTKFDELAGPRLSCRVFTPEQTKHAKTVVPSPKELFVDFGMPNHPFGQAKLSVPLMEKMGPAARMAIGYYLIGKIQEQHEPYFKKYIAGYCDEARRLFGEDGRGIGPVVN